MPKLIHTQCIQHVGERLAVLHESFQRLSEGLRMYKSE